MDNKLYFEHKGINYYFVGRPAEYYYDFGLIPLVNFPCSDMLEKTRLIYALYELFSISDYSKDKYDLPLPLFNELNSFFNEFTDYELSHWVLLDFETLNDFNVSGCNYHIDKSNGYLIMNSIDINIFIPKPYENIIGIGDDDNVYDVSEINLKEFKELTFSNDSDFPFLFMSKLQQQNNDLKINQFLNEIMKLFKKHNIQISSCEDLCDIYKKIYNRINFKN